GLDVIEVHDDVANVAGEPHTLAIGRDVKDLVCRATVEHHGVGAGLAFNSVAAVTRIPLEGIVASAEEGYIIALVAIDEVVAVATQQRIVAVATQQRVVAGTAVDGDLDQRREIAGGRKAVVAAVGVKDEILRRADVNAEGGGVEAVEAHSG